MDSPEDGEGPVVLNLHRWNSSSVPKNLSDYREAFLSPTREILLLLSHRSEALLLPLSSGDSYCITSGSCAYRNQEDVDPLLQSATRSDSSENIPSTPESKVVSDNGFSPESNVSWSNSYPFVSDVNSLAWGFPGDMYNQHVEATFREFLFVVGDCGVIVHAFRQHDETNELLRTQSFGDEDGKGRWVEWGPSCPFPSDTEAPETLNDPSRSGGAQRSSYSATQDSVSYRSSTLNSKKWLRSFLSSAKIMESDGSVWTRFPENVMLPCSANIVSFCVSFDDPLFLGFLNSGRSVSEEGASEEKAVHGSVNNEHKSVIQTSIEGPESDQNMTVRGFRTCLRVFSSSFFHLIGFVLSSGSNTLKHSQASSCNNRKTVVVARVDICGLQWLSTVELPQSDVKLGTEWIDFQISDKFLISLNDCGLVLFHGAMTGEYIAYLDVWQMYGLKPKQNLPEQENSLMNVNGPARDGVLPTLSDVRIFNSQSDDITGKPRFCRLITAPFSYLFTVVDEYGLVYVVCMRDHVPHKYFMHEVLLPQYLKLGILAPWNVGSADISQQKLFAACFGENSPTCQGMVSQGDLGLSGFSAVPHEGVEHASGTRLPRRIRNCILPIAKPAVADLICFSPLGITRLIRSKSKNERSCIAHTSLYTESNFCDDKCLDTVSKIFDLKTDGNCDDGGEAVGCVFQGCLYIITRGTMSVVLPAVSVSPNFHPVDLFGYQSIKTCQGTAHNLHSSLTFGNLDQLGSPWQVAILDRILLYEGPDEADCLCLENGWDLKVSRLRFLQLALAHLKFEEMEHALGLLAEINVAEEGILRLMFAAIHTMVHKSGNDAELSAARRILALATRFAIKMLREYAVLKYKKEHAIQNIRGMDISSSVLPLANKDHGIPTGSRRLHEMAYYLEIIRNLICQLDSRYKRPGQEMVDDRESLDHINEHNLLNDDHELSVVEFDAISGEKANRLELEPREVEMGFNATKELVMMPVESRVSEDFLTSELEGDVSTLLPGAITGRRQLHMENPKEMFARWEVDNLDLKNVVKDALMSGRLPLAVLLLHVQRIKDMIDNKQDDTFAEVREIGRAIAYELLLKGETALAATTLQKLGEDIETSLKQLLFGTVSRSLRKQISEETKKFGYLRSYEMAILDRISLIERVYPCSNFWRAYAFRRKELLEGLQTTNAPEGLSLRLLHPPLLRNLNIVCGDVDGVVLGSWTNVNGNASDVDDDSSHAGYWAAAAVWSNAWEQKTIDRILLDQPSLLGVYVMWDSQYEYHLCHNDWEEVVRLLDIIPNSVLSERSLLISLDDLQTSSFSHRVELPNYGSYMCSPDELDSVYIEVPNIRTFQCSANVMCSSYLRLLISKELAKNFIFLKEYWDGTEEMILLLAHSGFIGGVNMMSRQTKSSHQDSTEVEDFHMDTVQAFHKLLVHYCSQHNLPYLLDLYLDHHRLVLDNDTIISLQEAAGDCQWAKWLLFSRMKGHEYDASFYNARAIGARNMTFKSSLSVMEANEIIGTIDDIAEAGWIKAALATLMFAPLPIQKCLSSGSVRRNCNSFQCTLENLRPTLLKFPTMWRMLVSACFGQETTQSFYKGKDGLSVYISWRDSVFYSSGHDTSLQQMLPFWFPKNLRRLIHLYVKGPLGWQSMAGLPTEETYLQQDIEYDMGGPECSEISAMSWEAAIQNQIEQELYPSSVEDTGLALEQHLHRGRALAAFNQLLGNRVQNLKSDGTNRGHSSASVRGQVNAQSDVQMLLSPLTQSEECLLSSVVPLAITHYSDSLLVASCASLLELCGLSASTLRVDVAALRRIHSFYKSSYTEQQKQLLPNGATLHAASSEVTVADSLAQALADYYIHQENGGVKGGGDQKLEPNQQPSTPLMLIVQHLEKASILMSDIEKTSGSWLLSGDGNGNDLRSQQKAASEYWNLVTVFCQMHHLPLSTMYLTLLARDNDWIGFLSEAQVGGYPYDMVVQVAAQEFTDLRLKTHILAMLRGMQSRMKSTLPSSSDSSESKNETSLLGQSIIIPAELFQILAQCEKQKHPGKALLLKAKELKWSLLAVVASCFLDVTALSCLTVWLEITAARETQSVRENDIATQIAKNVGAAVQASNSLPAEERIHTFHFNRKNLKRRRLIDQVSEDFSSASINNCSSSDASILVEEVKEGRPGTDVKMSNGSEDWPMYLPKLIAVLCQQCQFLPLLRAFEMFLPSCPLLSFIRALQAFSQMRLSEASAHLGFFSYRITEAFLLPNIGREGLSGTSWISSTAVEAADAMLSTCSSPYEERCLLQLLASTDFGDGGSAAACYQRQCWKINLAEPALRKHEDLQLGNEILDDASLLTALENNGHWEQARNWARQLEATGGQWKSAFHHVTERQAESMVTEWKEFLWDVPEERVALWRHCQNLFIRYSYPALEAGLFFLKHAEAMENELPPKEIHELQLLSLQWLSGMITQSNPVCSLNLLREVETRVWLLAVESEAQLKSERDSNLTRPSQDQMAGNSANIVDQTAALIAKMDSHINNMNGRFPVKGDVKDNNFLLHKSLPTWEASISTASGSTKTKRRTKVSGSSRRSVADATNRSALVEEHSDTHLNFKQDIQDENIRLNASFSSWEEKVGPAELEKAVLSLLEYGQVTVAKQLQHKLSSGHMLFELKIVDAAIKFAELSTPLQKQSFAMLDEDLRSLIHTHNIPIEDHLVDPFQVLERLSVILIDGSGYGLCKRIVAVVKAANILGVPFLEAFEKQPTELLQLLSLRAQDSFEEARLLVQTHPMPATSIAKILAESFLKGLLAAHRGGYVDSQEEEGPSPLLWRYSDFLKWAELCPSEQEIGHALMRLVITGQEIPHACEVELLILSHHFYQSSACLDGVDVLVALAATRVDAYVLEGDFSCLARLITGVGNFHTLIFILSVLIENGQLDLLLQKYSAAADANTAVAEAVRGFRMAVLTALKHFNSNDLDAFAMVYNHFDMKHETAILLESRAEQCCQRWFHRQDKDQNEDLLDSMHYYVEAAEVYSSIDAGNKTHSACAQASLVSLQIRMPDIQWLYLSETNARSLLVEQSRFQEALIVAEAYKLNHPSEWTPVLWNQMLKPELAEQFIAEFVAVLPLQHSTLIELAKIYKSELVARGDKPHISVFWTVGGLPAEWAKYLGRSIRCLLNRTRDLRWRLQMATTATGFTDVIIACNKALDKVPENAGPLVLRKGHGGAYLPVM